MHEEPQAFGHEHAEPPQEDARRRFDSMEVGAMISSLALASIARCPDDDARLVADVASESITLVCPSCGARAEWRMA
jgi:hypothetical protein